MTKQRVSGAMDPAVLFAALLRQHRLPVPVTEFRFDPHRQWRFDYAWLDTRLALEVEGGVWTQGRHTRGAGFLADIEKYNRAALLGWRVLRTTPSALLTLDTVTLVRTGLSVPALPPAA